MISSIHNDLTIVMVRKKIVLLRKFASAILLLRQLGEISRMSRQKPQRLRSGEANFNACNICRKNIFVI